MPPAKCPHCGTVVTSEARVKNVCSSCKHPLVLPLPDAPEVAERWDDDLGYAQQSSRRIGIGQLLKLSTLRTSLSCVAIGSLLVGSSWMIGLSFVLLIRNEFFGPGSLFIFSMMCTHLIYIGVVMVLIGCWMGSSVFQQSPTAVLLSICFNLSILLLLISTVTSMVAQAQNEAAMMERMPWKEGAIQILEYAVHGFAFLAYTFYTLYLIHIANCFQRSEIATGFIAILVVSILGTGLLMLLVGGNILLVPFFGLGNFLAAVVVSVLCFALIIWYASMLMMFRRAIVQEIGRRLG